MIAEQIGAKRWDGELKKVARQIAMDFNSNPAFAAIFLPAKDCDCLTHAIASQTINREKMLFLIEKKVKWCEDIRNYAERNLNNFYLHHGEADTLYINRLIDFAYLDFIGSMDDGLYAWIKNQIVPNLICNSRISFCFNYAWRPEVPFLKKRYQEYYEQDKIFAISSEYRTEGSYQIATYLLILKDLFPNHRFVFYDNKPYFRYQDNINPMVLYTLEANQSLFVPKSIAPKERSKPMLSNITGRATLSKKDLSNITGRAMLSKKALPSRDLDTLISEYPQALANPDKMRGWKRAKTLLCRNKANASGGKPKHFDAAIKMRLTKLGFDTAPLR